MSSTEFINDDFLLETGAAKDLYHGFAEGMPIIDYHCHLQPGEIAADQRWENITQVWLAGDHYKWRAMRSNGIPERYVTGDADDREKFARWAETAPYLLRNPLYHWTHLELKRYFGIGDRLLSPATAQSIWEDCNARLADPSFSARGLMKQSKVVLVCTTDDPTDSLEHHAAVAADPALDVQVLPTWRPDAAMAVEDTEAYNAWIGRLEEATDLSIGDFDIFMEALQKRHAFFHSMGCRLSDHGVGTLYAENYTTSEIQWIFAKVRGGDELTGDEVRKFQSAMMVEFGIMDAEADWTQQVHYGVLRNNNTRRMEEVGRDSGFDSIGDFSIGRALNTWLDRLDRQQRLPRTIIYNINPRDNALVATAMGNFQDASVPGKMQFGSGWWFLDQKDGMERQMEALSQLGLLSRFVGMLTDSRSFLSYTRHEYFRRILCNILGSDIEKGLVPKDMELVGGMVRDICYNNAARYFGFDVPTVD
jgi:glucuronate isomerase